MIFFKFLSIIFICSFFISCSSDENATQCILNSVHVKALYYEEVSILAYNPNFSGKINYEYDAQGRMTKIVGGPRRLLQGYGFADHIYDDTTVSNVMYAGDTIKVDNLFTEYPYPDINDFVIKNGKILYKKVNKYDPGYNLAYTYEFSDDLITETNSNNKIRKFYISNGNLQKVEKIISNGNQIIGKEELVFSNYDTTPNLLKGKFYINGAFYAAFSNNNYKKWERKTYNYVDNEYVLNGEGSSFFDFSINEDGIADLFEQTCN